MPGIFPAQEIKMTLLNENTDLVAFESSSIIGQLILLLLQVVIKLSSKKTNQKKKDKLWLQKGAH